MMLEDVLMEKKIQFLKFVIAFSVAYAIPIIFFCCLEKIFLPPSRMLAELFGHYLFMSVIALLIAVIISKKGKPISPFMFGLLLTVLGFRFFLSHS